jgi:hypothetical protein
LNVVEDEMSVRKRPRKVLRSAACAYCSIYPVTVIEFEVEVALVVGIPYRACKHAGVIWLAHEDGTAAVALLTMLLVMGRGPVSRGLLP